MFVSLTSIVTSSTLASAAPCRVPGTSAYKWNSYLDEVDIFSGNPPAGSVDSWPFASQRLFYSRLHKNSAEEACAAYATYHAYNSAYTKAQRNVRGGYYIDAEHSGYRCAFDCAGGVNNQGNGVIDDNDHSTCGTVLYWVTRDTEAVCDRVPNGPYKDKVSFRGATPRGGSFGDSFRERVIAVNKGGTANPIRSDVYGIDDYFVLTRNDEVLQPYEDDPDVSTMMGNLFTPRWTGDYAQTVQIDHIIPRIDKYGCGCGPNSPANALVISAALNGQLSNNTAHVGRQLLIEQYTLPAMKRANDAQPDDLYEPGVSDDEADEVVDDHELGGCSTGGGAGGLAGLGVLGLATLTRRKRRVS